MSFSSVLKDLRVRHQLSLRELAGRLKVDHAYLSRLESGTVPSSDRVIRALGKLFQIPEEELRISAGKFPQDVSRILYDNPKEAASLLRERFAIYNTLPAVRLSGNGHRSGKKRLAPIFETDRGKLYRCDCLDLLPTIPTESIDCVFADPPFNLRKHYGHRVNDDLEESEYLQWSYQWLAELTRVLKPGGSLFVYNLPKWNVLYGAFLIEHADVSALGGHQHQVYAPDSRKTVPIAL